MAKWQTTILPDLYTPFLDQLDELRRFQRLAVDGLSFPRLFGEFQTAMRDILGELPGEPREEVAFPADDIDFANRQHGQGYPVVNNLCAVHIVSVIEAAVEEFALFVIRERPIVLQAGENRPRVTGDLLQFMYASDADRAEMILRSFEELAKRDNQTGVGYFESVLKRVGLGGGVPDIARRTMTELLHVRNALVHRAGKADVRLCSACPWLPWTPGQPIRTSPIRLSSYFYVARWYLDEIYVRLSRAAEWPRPSDREPDLSGFLDDQNYHLQQLERTVAAAAEEPSSSSDT